MSEYRYGGFRGTIREMRDLLVRLMPESSPTPPAGEDGEYVAYAVPWDVVREARRAVGRYDAMEARAMEMAAERPEGSRHSPESH